MTEKRTFVDASRYLFTTEVMRAGFPTFVAVHWTGVGFVPESTFLRPLRAYVRPRHEVSEVWFLYPIDLAPQFDELSTSRRFDDDDDDEPFIPREYRYFSVDVSGAFTEQLCAEPHEHPVDDGEMEEVLTDGLRQLFRDTEALATAAAGFHFAHPSGTHSAYFIRASQAVSRLQHAYFVGMSLLRTLTPRADATVWVDTGSISSAGYAYTDLLRRGGVAGAFRVESFGGYGGLATQLRPSPADVVLISGSTSGSLARQVLADKKLHGGHVVTLFYISSDPWTEASGVLLCDLSNTDPQAHPSVRQSRIEPYLSYRDGQCVLCRDGSGEIQLEGDSFFPATSELDLRMPSFYDRPLTGVSRADRRKQGKLTWFDGSDYFQELLGTGAITFSAGTPVDASPHGVSTRLGHLLRPGESGRVRDRILAAARGTIAGQKVAGIVSLRDSDSTALGAMLADEFLGSGHVATLTEPTDDDSVVWQEWRRKGLAELRQVNEEIILVCAAVVGSGREVTSVSRELRKVVGAFHTRYLVVAAHPESSTTWEMFTQTLERKSDSETAALTHIWKLPREPRFPGSKSPWARERDTLQTVGLSLITQPGGVELSQALSPRVLELGRLESNLLFVGSVAGKRIAPVNAKFSLWPFDWQKHRTGAVPTHAEIYATVAHLLYESRRRNARIDNRMITARRHGYALHPAVFDRYNDPVIQAAILRAAEPGELNYQTSADASRAVADLLWFVLASIGTEAGDASYEFLLALCEGAGEGPRGLRIAEHSLRTLLAQVEGRYGEGFKSLADGSPHVRVLLLYLKGTLAPVPVADVTPKIVAEATEDQEH